MIEQNHLLYALSVLEGSLSGIDNKKLSNDVLSNKDKRISTVLTESSYEDNNISWSAEIKTILNTMSNGFEKFTGTHTLTSAQYWGHIQEKNMSCNLHSHGNDGCDLSAVYYPCDNASACKLVFQWETDFVNANRHWFEPTQGIYYLFPSYLKHWVTRNLTEKPRVSISFNFNIVSK